MKLNWRLVYDGAVPSHMVPSRNRRITRGHSTGKLLERSVDIERIPKQKEEGNSLAAQAHVSRAVGSKLPSWHGSSNRARHLSREHVRENFGWTTVGRCYSRAAKQGHARGLFRPSSRRFSIPVRRGLDRIDCGRGRGGTFNESLTNVCKIWARNEDLRWKE
jgi:hypothetical protein